MINKFKSKPAVIAVICAFVILMSVLCVWFFTGTENGSAPEASSPQQQEQTEKVNDIKHKYTEPQLREIARQTACEQFGDDAFIIFLSSEGPSEIEIYGTKRNIYIYAAESKSIYEQTGKIRGLYHVDADTGEIFDNGNGNMEKIKSGE